MKKLSIGPGIYFLAIFTLFLAFPLYLSAQERISQKEIILPDESGNMIKLYNQSHALLIGVVQYNNGWPVLYGVEKDVIAVREALEKQGFNVVVVLDPDRNQLSQAYSDFINEYGMDPENRLILYYAGHGHTVKASYGEEMGYIVPVESPNPNTDRSGFLATAMAMQQIEVFAKQIQSKHALFLFDACFSGSIFSISRAVPEIITYKTGKPVRQFITSGSAEETVPDESIFRQQLIAALSSDADRNQDGFITGSELGEFLQETVVNYSRGSQHPQYGKIRNPNLDKGDFVFYIGPGQNQTTDRGISDVQDVNVSTRSQNQPGKDIDPVIDDKSDIDFLNPPSNIIKPWIDEINDVNQIFSKVALRTFSGNYFRAESGGGGKIKADREIIGGQETFDYILLDDNKIAFQTQNGYYLSAKSNKTLDSKPNSLGPAETFKIVELEQDKVALTSFTDRYLSAVNGGGKDIAANEDRVREYEVFSFVKLNRIRLRSQNKRYLEAVNCGGSEVNVGGLEKEEILYDKNFIFVKVDDNKIALRTEKGYYLSVTANGATAVSKNIGETEKFEFTQIDKNKIALKASNGKYIQAVGGGGFALKAISDDIDDWETFQLIFRGPPYY